MTREEFNKAHKRCPKCFSKRLRVTLVGIAEIDGNYEDNVNTAVCGCGWSGKVNELIPNTFRRKLIEWGKMTNTGHIYLKDEVNLPQTRILFGFPERTSIKDSVSLKSIAALGSPVVDNDALYIDIMVYDAPDEISVDVPINEISVIFLTLLNQGYNVIPDGYGRIDDDGVTVRDYNLHGFYLRKEGYQ